MSHHRLSEATPPVIEGRARPVADGQQPPFAAGGADGAVAAGLGAGLALLTCAILLGGSAAAFFDPASLLVVLGGTVAAVVVCFSFGDVKMTARMVAGAVLRAAPDPRAAAARALRLAVEARLYGGLHLEHRLEPQARSPFLSRALSLVADGVGPGEVEALLVNDVQATPHRFRRSAAVLRRAAECAPAMGLIGTLIGLVQMLGELGDPQQMGPSMALALLTTLYGAVLAHLVFSPLAVKLERGAVDEELVCRIYLLAAVSISKRENPRRLELLLNGLLPPAMRVAYFD